MPLILAAQSTVVTIIVNVISAHCYCDPVTFMIKKDIQIASGLHFGRSIYAQKAKEITFLIQLVTYQIHLE
jgi:hypothetical protein